MSISQLQGKVAPIHLWAPVHEVESQALDQLKNIAALPWVFHHVAVMPDCHLGKGCTVGSVIAMKGAVSPAAVGVDIGCVDRESEYLSPTGWRRIDQYDGGPIMQYDPETDVGSWSVPLAYVKKPSDGFYYFRTKYGINQKLSSDHRVLCWKISGRDRRRERQVIRAGDLALEHDRLVLGAKVEFKTTFSPRLETALPLTDAQIRVQVAVIADGHFGGGGNYVRTKFVKTRKKTRMRQLLIEAGIEFREEFSKDSRYEEGEVLSFYFEAPMRARDYSRFWGASLHQLGVIKDECFHWDGNHDECVFFSRSKESADFIQYAFSATGLRAVICTDVRSDGALDYRVFGVTDDMPGLAGAPKTPVEFVPSEDGLEYCFTVSSGFWVMRRHGRVVVTGNCGMAAVKTNLTASDLPDSLQALRLQIEATIPVGFSSHEEVSRHADKHPLWKEFHNLHDSVQDIVGKARKQMGTLGSGNHFWSLCLDGDQSVWVMLHSGSRNIGKTLAEIHMSVAKTLIHNAELPDKDLAVFLAGTPEMAHYRRDLNWCQDYALANRQVMLKLSQDVLTKAFPHIRYEEPITCHHNYVSEENHFGEQVLITRKGAVSARNGELGIIPGSMGTKSFIVRGLGNPESFHSASHGAGRKMSRGAAKRKFTLEDLAEQTAGVECRKDQGVLDEIPGAYKDLDQVMAYQADLVEIVACLKEVLCVKG